MSANLPSQPFSYQDLTVNVPEDTSPPIATTLLSEDKQPTQQQRIQEIYNMMQYNLIQKYKNIEFIKGDDFNVKDNLIKNIGDLHDVAYRSLMIRNEKGGEGRIITYLEVVNEISRLLDARYNLILLDIPEECMCSYYNIDAQEKMNSKQPPDFLVWPSEIEDYFAVWIKGRASPELFPIDHLGELMERRREGKIDLNLFDRLKPLSKAEITREMPAGEAEGTPAEQVENGQAAKPGRRFSWSIGDSTQGKGVQERQ